MDNIKQTNIINNCEYSYVFSDNSENQIYESHCHAEYELILVLQGNITIVIEDRMYFLCAGSIAVISPTAYHSLFCEDKSKYERITILIPGEKIFPEINNHLITASAKTSVINSDRCSRIAAEMKKALLCNNVCLYSPLISALTTELIYSFTFENNSESLGTFIDSDIKIQKIMAYVNENICNKLTLDEISANIYLSKSAICHIFKQKLKISLKQYILQKKIAYAEKLLANGVTANEAAKTVGYDNYANFYNVYKKITGKKPSYNLRK